MLPLDIIDERIDMMKEKYGCKIYNNVKDLVNDPDVELVDIATRSRDHYKHAKMALDAGKAVLVEKPLSVEYEEAKDYLENLNKYREQAREVMAKFVNCEADWKDLYACLDRLVNTDEAWS